jgi:hypothetical protein
MKKQSPFNGSPFFDAKPFSKLSLENNNMSLHIRIRILKILRILRIDRNNIMSLNKALKPITHK